MIEEGRVKKKISLWLWSLLEVQFYSMGYDRSYITIVNFCAILIPIKSHLSLAINLHLWIIRRIYHLKGIRCCSSASSLLQSQLNETFTGKLATLRPDEILPTSFILRAFLRVVINVDDFPDHVLTVGSEIAVLIASVGSMLVIVMIVIRESSNWRLLAIRMESIKPTPWIRRRSSGK